MLADFIYFFATLGEHPILRLVLLVSGLLFFWIIEGSIPLLQPQYKKNKLRHASVNLAFTAIHLVIHTALAVVIVLLSDWCSRQQFGLVHWFNAGIGLTILVSFLTLDFFGGWLVHITEHKIPFLWRFHVIHHSDNNVDVTTGLRHHPAESILRGLFFFVGIVISGAPMYAVMIYQTALVFFTAFTHANLNLPGKLDKLVSYVLISPNMHKVHHHWKQPYTDTNYGAILSIWDRLTGNYSELPPSDIRYGIDKDFPNERDEDFLALLKGPFAARSGKV